MGGSSETVVGECSRGHGRRVEEAQEERRKKAKARTVSQVFIMCKYFTIKLPIP